MPSLFFDVQEVEETKTGKVNKSGYLYVGRRHMGKNVVWVKVKDNYDILRKYDSQIMQP